MDLFHLAWAIHCTSLLHGITDELLQKLQSIQNAAARLVTGAWLYDHITPVLLAACEKLTVFNGTKRLICANCGEVSDG